MDNILRTAGIDPRKVIDIKEVKNICPWCHMICGTLARLIPCKHLYCENCINSIVDLNIELCPHCQNGYSDFIMDTTKH